MMRIFTIGATALASVLADVPLITFDGQKNTTFDFKELNDPVMGGKSIGTWQVKSTEGYGVFDGEVVNVPSLSAPGFIKTVADGSFNDLSSVEGGDLLLTLRSTTPDYAGYRVTLYSGSGFASYACSGGGSLPLSRGCYKSKFTAPAGPDFSTVRVPFASFSDLWSPATGEQSKTCAEQPDACLTAKQLSSIKRVEVWAEGVAGKVHLELKSISAAPATAKLGAAVAGMSCPGSSASIHASCKQTASTSASCAVVGAEIKARVNGQYGSWHDPHNNGTYSILSSTDSVIQLQRMTGDKKYTDKITISLDAGSSGCTISGCSESQVTSIADFSTNYCNVRMLYCGSADGCKPVTTDLESSVTNVSPSFGASKSMSDCLKV